MESQGAQRDYFRTIQSFPLLDADEEGRLVRRWHDDRDQATLDRLVTSYLRLVARVARRYQGHGISVDDLVSEGAIGLIQAIGRFEPGRGSRLGAYAVWWIRAAIQTHILRSASLVRITGTSTNKKLFFNLPRWKRQLQANGAVALSPEAITAIATELGVPAQDVAAMDQRIGKIDLSLNTAVGDSGVERQDLLVDDVPDPEMRLVEDDDRARRRALLAAGLAALDERERRILVERRLRDQPATLETLGRRFGVSGERVRQIETRAFEKLQQSMLAAAHQSGLLAAA